LNIGGKKTDPAAAIASGIIKRDWTGSKWKSAPLITRVNVVGWLNEGHRGHAGRPVEEQAGVVGYLTVFYHVGLFNVTQSTE
jgi:hypothetical protein